MTKLDRKDVVFDTFIPRTGIIGETDKALCISVRTSKVGQYRMQWIPKKLCKWIAPSAIYSETLNVPFWFAKQNNLI